MYVMESILYGGPEGTVQYKDIALQTKSQIKNIITLQTKFKITLQTKLKIALQSEIKLHCKLNRTYIYSNSVGSAWFFLAVGIQVGEL